jgi:CPA2 family monovalent cation:H+ antiporter-2
LRRDHYHPAHEMGTEHQEIRLLKNARDLLELNWQRLGDDSLMVGQSIHDLDIRRSTGVSVVGVLREGSFTANPPADFTFTSGDLVALLGGSSQCAGLGKKAFSAEQKATTQ